MKLSQEVLELLVLDRAGGGLTPEAEALLHAYLAQNPDAAQATRLMEEILELAKQALGPARSATLPEPRFLKRRRLAWSWPEWRQFLQPLPVGAGLVAGLLLGWWAGTVPGRPTAELAWAKSLAQPGPTLPAVTPAVVSSAPTFWSARPGRHHPETKPPYSLVWDSTAKKPKIKENL